MNNYLADAYLEYCNDYISVDTFAEGKQIKRADALMVINMGREYHYERVKRLKEVDNG